MQDGRGVALSLHHLGDIARRQQDYERARSLYDQSLRILLELGDRRALGHLLTDMGNMAGESRDFDDARRWHEESMVIFSELGDVRGIADLFEAIMRIWITRGHLESALCLGGAAARLRED
jgi:tetratricopeptide (TPR) repeat protein